MNTVIKIINSNKQMIKYWSGSFFLFRSYHALCSVGIILRLALPVTIFLLIVGFSFWGDSDKRVDIALNMTLVVAALYLGR